MSGLAEILDENRRLREVLAAQTAALAERDIELEKQRAKLDAVTARADYLEKTLELIDLKQRGPVSQRYVPDEQAALPFPGDVAPPPRAPRSEPDEDENDDPATRPKGKRRKRRRKAKRRNREAFSHLPSRTVRCSMADDESCVQCGGALAVIGQAESFRIEWVPGHFVVEDVVRDKCSCPRCPDQGVLTVPGPYAIDRALCGNALLARVLVDKFADHIPLHRQARRMAREGFEVGTNTLSRWVLMGTGLLAVIADAVKGELLASP